MYDNPEPIYDDSLARPAPPLFWMVLSAVLGLCCVSFFVTSAAETYLLMNGYSLVVPAASDKPTLGEIKFYTDQTASGEPSGAAVTRVTTGTKTIYAYFTYKNVPRTPVTWSYMWTLNGVDLPGASKSNQRWTREGSGTYFLKLNDDKGLKPGPYELTVNLADDEQIAAITVGQ